MRFSRGVRIDDDGREMSELMSGLYDSRSTGERNKYRAVVWADGCASCNCRGWATHHVTKGHLACEHARDVHRQWVLDGRPGLETCGYTDMAGHVCSRSRSHVGAHTYTMPEGRSAGPTAPHGCTCGPTALSVQRCVVHGPSFREGERLASQRRAEALERRRTVADAARDRERQRLARLDREAEESRRQPPDDEPPRPERRIVL